MEWSVTSVDAKSFLDLKLDGTLQIGDRLWPIETLFDVTVAATAHARSIPNTDKRLEIEREAGDLLQAA